MSNEKFSGGENFEGFHKLVHEAMMVNELRSGRGAYKLMRAVLGKSGYSYGGNQMDLAHNPSARNLLKDLLVHQEVDAASVGRILGVVADYKKVLSSKDEKLVNNCLSSSYAKEKINQAYVHEINERVEKVNSVVNKVANPAVREYLKGDYPRLFLVDYHNQIGIGPQFISYLNGNPIKLGGKVLSLPKDRLIGINDLRDFLLATKHARENPNDIRRRQKNIFDVISNYSLDALSEELEVEDPFKLIDQTVKDKKNKDDSKVMKAALFEDIGIFENETEHQLGDGMNDAKFTLANVKPRNNFSGLNREKLLVKFLAAYGLRQEQFNNEILGGIGKILGDLEDRNRREESAARFNNAQQAYQDIGRLGAVMRLPVLEKIGNIGQNLVSIERNLGALGVTNIPGLSALTSGAAYVMPYVGIAIAVFSIASSLFGKKKSDNGLGKAIQEIIKQLHEVRKELREMRQEMHLGFENVIDTVIALGECIEKDFRRPVLALLNTLKKDIERSLIILDQGHKDIYVRHLYQVIDELRQSDIKLDQDRIEHKLPKLVSWFEQSCSPLLNGENYLLGHGLGHEAEWGQRVLTLPKANAGSLLGYLAGQYSTLTHHEGLFDRSQIMNVGVWYEAVSNYFDLVSKYDLIDNIARDNFRKIIEQTDNALKFFDEVSSSKTLFSRLLEMYKESMSEVNSVIKEGYFTFIKKNVGQLPGGDLALEAVFAKNTEMGDKFEVCLSKLDCFHQMLEMYSSIAGLDDVYKKVCEGLLTSKHVRQKPIVFPSSQSRLPLEFVRLDGELKLVIPSGPRECIEEISYQGKNGAWVKLTSDVIKDIFSMTDKALNLKVKRSSQEEVHRIEINNSPELFSVQIVGESDFLSTFPMAGESKNASSGDTALSILLAYVKNKAQLLSELDDRKKNEVLTEKQYQASDVTLKQDCCADIDALFKDYISKYFNDPEENSGLLDDLSAELYALKESGVLDDNSENLAEHYISELRYYSGLICTQSRM